MNDTDKTVLVPYRWVILAVAMLAGFIGSYAQFQLPPLAYKLIPALHLSTSQFAALMGGPMTGSIFICLLGGTLSDRYGVKKVVAVGLLSAASTFWSWQLPIGTAIVIALAVAGFWGGALLPMFLSLPMLLPEIGPR